MIEQLGIALMGGIAAWLSQDRRTQYQKWASVFGIAGQPFWIYTTFTHAQWGMLALTGVYTASYVRGFVNHWIRGNND